jgi:hypothetical protein
MRGPREEVTGDVYGTYVAVRQAHRPELAEERVTDD